MMGSTVSRWGGNQVSRYNWEINDSNSGSDWGLCQQSYLGRGAFSNVGYNQGAAGVSLRSKVDDSKTQNMAVLFTVPMVGWVAKDGNNGTCSSNVPANDGPPINSTGAISGYDPTTNRNTTSIRSQIKKGSTFTFTPSTSDGVVYQDELINYMVSTYGNAQNGGIKFYAFDNEYDLWSSTHRDIHPSQVGYDELSSLFNQFSDAVKAVDPTAQVTGPVSWGWTNYWYSSLDKGTNNYGTNADRNAHGNVPLLQWFLRQAKAREAQVGYRALDVLDVHYYPQGGQALNSDDSTTMQALRLRSVRDLWDPTYTNESWEAGTEGGPQVQVIRRLQGWINQEYPGTKLGFTEWNWGDDDKINGGLTIADVLGVFGRENVYLANYWTTPGDQTPGYWAWRMYRNYDGSFSKFGDISVNASTASTNVDKISVYASKDSTTGELKIMAINKQPGNDENTTFNLANFASNGTAKVYRYSQADTSKINQLANLSGIGTSFTYNLTPYSVTLFVLPPSTNPTPSPTPTKSPSPSPTSTATPTPTPTTSPIPGDIDKNGKVDIFDYNILVGNFGKTGTGIQGDLDNNGTVNIFDYNTLVTNFGRTS
jgi:hypothetical protein